jgi:hypothetical protein
MDRKLGFDATTRDMEAAEEDLPQTGKILINGQLHILRNGVVYTPAGQIINR